MAGKNPARNYAIEYVGKGSRSDAEIAAIAASAITAAADPTGDPLGEVTDGDSPFIEGLPTEETDPTKRLRPNGAGGVEWAASTESPSLTNSSGERHVPGTVTAGSAEELDLSAANWFDVTLTEACALSFANPPGSGVGGIWTIILRGEFDVTWPAEVVWRDADGAATSTPPAMSGDENVVVVTTLDGGATYGASLENGSTTFGTPAVTYGTPAAGSSGQAIQTDAVLPNPVTSVAVRDAGRWEPTVDDGTDTLIFDAHTVVMDWTTS